MKQQSQSGNPFLKKQENIFSIFLSGKTSKEISKSGSLELELKKLKLARKSEMRNY